MTVDLAPSFPLTVMVILAAALLAVLVLLRRVFGPPAANARRWELLAIRWLVIAGLLLVLANPVRIDEMPVAGELPEVCCLLDVSDSMSLGDETTCFEQAIRTIQDAQDLAPSAFRPHLNMYCFGRGFSAIECGESFDPKSVPQPAEADTQLRSALRELAGRFGRVAPAAVVLFSDGRVRDPAGVEEIARRYAEMEVPIHTMCCGAANRGGDVSIINMIVPSRVRKYSQVGVQLFVRSFGCDGRRAELALAAVDDDGNAKRQLNRTPITLRSGVQSFHLTYRSALAPERIQASIAPLADEVASNDNEFAVDVDVDRTKICVLMLGSGAEPALIHPGLSEDPDISFVFQSSGFPASRAELFAYDALFLSDVPRERLSQTQLDWIREWIADRGGGLCMAGGPRSFGGWENTVIADMLPVAMIPDTRVWLVSSRIGIAPSVSTPLHPIWHFVTAESENVSILKQFPDVTGVNRGLHAKTTATVLATVHDDAEEAPAPVIAAASRAAPFIAMRDSPTGLAGAEAFYGACYSPFPCSDSVRGCNDSSSEFHNLLYVNARTFPRKT